MLLFLLFRDLQSKNRNHEGKTRRSVTFFTFFKLFFHQNGGVAFFFLHTPKAKTGISAHI